MGGGGGGGGGVRKVVGNVRSTKTDREGKHVCHNYMSRVCVWWWLGGGGGGGRQKDREMMMIVRYARMKVLNTIRLFYSSVPDGTQTLNK